MHFLNVYIFSLFFTARVCGLFLLNVYYRSNFIYCRLNVLLISRSGNILSFLLPLFQEGQLSVTGESMCTKYWLTA